MTADAKQPLLQIAIARQLAGFHDAVDATVDHDRDLIRNRSRYADVLLDDKHRQILFIRQADQQIAHLRNDERRQALGRLVHDKQPGIGQQRP